VTAGSRLEIFVTRARTRSGRYRFGAVGNYFSYEFKAAGIRRRLERCLRPGSRTPRRRCL
jgi:hypothetical protein